METIELHNKQKGNIAEAIVELDLKIKGYSVFKELGDLSKIDLIAEKNSQIIRLQVKGITPNENGSLHLRAIKTGPNYSFKYTEDMFDYFAVVDLTSKQVGYIPSNIFGEQNNIHLRVRDTMNNQTNKVKYLKDYQLSP